MNVKAYLAALAGSVFSFFGGWVIFGMLLADFYKSHTAYYAGLDKIPMPDLVFLFLGGLCSSFLITIIFVKWANIKSFSAGFTNGALIIFFITAMFDFNLYGFYNLQDLTLTLVDIIAGTVFGGVMGGLIGFILGTGKQE